MFSVNYNAAWQQRRVAKSMTSKHASRMRSTAAFGANIALTSVWSKSKDQAAFLLRALRSVPDLKAFGAEDLMVFIESMHVETPVEGSQWTTPPESIAVIETGCFEDEAAGEVFSTGRVLSQHASLRVLADGRVWVLSNTTVAEYQHTQQTRVRSKALVSIFPALKALSLDLLAHIASLFETRHYRQGEVIVQDLYSSDDCAIIESGKAAVHICRTDSEREGAHEDGGSAEELAVMGPNAMIGGMMRATRGGSMRAFICAKENNTSVAVINREHLKQYLKDTS